MDVLLGKVRQDLRLQGHGIARSQGCVMLTLRVPNSRMSIAEISNMGNFITRKFCQMKQLKVPSNTICIVNSGKRVLKGDTSLKRPKPSSVHSLNITHEADFWALSVVCPHHCLEMVGIKHVPISHPLSRHN